MQRLEKQDPDSLQTAELKARLLKAAGNGQEAIALLQTHAQKKDVPRLAVAGLLEELGEGSAAETLYRKHVEMSGRSDAVLLLGAHLGRRGQLKQALEVFDEAWKSCPPRRCEGGPSH